MDIYSKKSRWKIYLFAAAVIILGISLIYTRQVANQLAVQEKKRAELWAGAIVELTKNFDDTTAFAEANVDFIFSIIQDNKTIPVILTDEFGNIVDFANLDTAKVFSDPDPMTGFNAKYLQRQKEIMATTNDSILIENASLNFKNYVFYKNSKLYTILANFPFFQLILILVFVIVSYLAFSSARRAEQNQVWVGMSKETAHQLGTPISGIIGWIEHLKEMAGDDEYQQMIVEELGKDVGRLNLIAERFSKIGAIPELTDHNIYDNIRTNMEYMKTRAPRKVVFNIPDSAEPLMANINAPLFDWVLENLMRNALDAMGGKGGISAEVFQDDDFVYIDMADTGSGIPQNKWKTIFKPGYSTKKRGWGLGLSLTKRIIENYHNGKIFVKDSELDQGTTFRIQLPKK